MPIGHAVQEAQGLQVEGLDIAAWTFWTDRARPFRHATAQQSVLFMLCHLHDASLRLFSHPTRTHPRGQLADYPTPLLLDVSSHRICPAADPAAGTPSAAGSATDWLWDKNRRWSLSNDRFACSLTPLIVPQLSSAATSCLVNISEL